jgi:hypothetical protein
MLETKEIEGERDPTTSRWKISKHAVEELAPEESSHTKEPLLSEEPLVTDKDTVELLAAEQMADNEEALLSSQPLRED